MDANQFTDALLASKGTGGWVQYHTTERQGENFWPDQPWGKLIEQMDPEAMQIQSIIMKHLKANTITLVQRKRTVGKMTYYDYLARLA